MGFLYFIFLVFGAADIIIFHSVWWMPILFISLLPFIFIFGSRQLVWFSFTVSSLTLWLLSGLNLGIVVFSFGIMLLFEKWITSKLLNKDAWQTFIASSVGILVFGMFLFTLSYFLDSSKLIFSELGALNLLFSAVLSVLLMYPLRRLFYVNKK